MKRIFDIAVSSILLLVISPILLITYICVRVALGSPAIFKQERPGKDKRVFQVYKFRTMSDARDSAGQLLPDAHRITPFGTFLRSTSLDELPQLWNVLRGDMSLVGPRPLLVKHLPYFTKREQKRFHVRPGITGLAQVKGRNHLSWNERLELDVQYVENGSFWLDIKILFLTIITVVKREGVALPGSRGASDLDKERYHSREG
ncbi:hypothetical protein AZ66_16340 [Paenibacillus sp. E194]|uniref:sugar transferase n=1 Tax=Paenibacillus sp. E194 TaxID=1458845 RepID=UPI0005DADF20|nr:sugar transferase [Paenibacillus sp. E194]KJB86879.1 hypothetical protein AZ66_16340 [Paenibacillus sp. E194]